MTEIQKERVQTVNTISQTVEVPTNQQQQKVEKKTITLQGFTTSRVEKALKGSKTQGQSPYPARIFLRLDCVDCHNTKQLCQALTPKHRKCKECAEQKCRKCEIPVFFRIKDEKDNWLKPKIKKGSYLQVEGNFDKPINSNRKSFTATSYQLLNQELTQEIEVNHDKK